MWFLELTLIGSTAGMGMAKNEGSSTNPTLTGEPSDQMSPAIRNHLVSESAKAPETNPGQTRFSPVFMKG
jgi:hypothetical protein